MTAAVESAWSQSRGQSTAADVQDVFWKDGYCDSVGRFEYAVSTGQIRQASKFAILVLSQAHGASISIVDPPSLMQ